jgi:mannosyltransferase OCH1-like enzyme
MHENNIIREKEYNNLINSNFFKHQRVDLYFEKQWIDQSNWEWIIKKYDEFNRQNNSLEKVPKIIHQIWIGSSVPKKYDAWRKSWLKYNPDFKYILWDEKAILKLGLINERQFLQAKNPGVKSDIARYEILFRFGGIYVDTDFEALKPIDSKLLSMSFIAGQVFSYSPSIANGLMISIPNFILLKKLIENLSVYRENMSPMEILNYSGPQYMTKIIFNNREALNDIVIFPSQYFYPWPNFMIKSEKNPYSLISDKSICIHHWEMSWMKKSYLRNFFNYFRSFLFK